MTLFSLATAPILIFCTYILIRDKYEKEPIRLLFFGLLYGAIISAPILKTSVYVSFYTPQNGKFFEALFNSYIVSGFIEEFYKFIFLYFLVYKNINFNEWFDGIVYAVFISLGFAFVENILYVFNYDLGGLTTAFYRAIFSVPGHGFFGVSMGYYLALAKFKKDNKIIYLLKSLLVPWILHGTYNMILSYENNLYMVIFILFVIVLWTNGLKKIKKHVENSPFKKIKKYSKA